MLGQRQEAKKRTQWKKYSSLFARQQTVEVSCWQHNTPHQKRCLTLVKKNNIKMEMCSTHQFDMIGTFSIRICLETKKFPKSNNLLTKKRHVCIKLEILALMCYLYRLQSYCLSCLKEQLLRQHQNYQWHQQAHFSDKQLFTCALIKKWFPKPLITWL